jgi:Arc/MetJ family transcription regulator
MRTTISIPDALAERVHRRAGNVTLAEFARLALQERLERLEREELARAMSDGYAAEAAAPSLEVGWDVTELEGWA